MLTPRLDILPPPQQRLWVELKAKPPMFALYGVTALDHAPPGILDPRSWAYWNVLADRYPPPPMPRRVLG